MNSKNRYFADDGWAVWVDGDDTSTVYLNNWINPKGKSYMDVGVKVMGIKSTRGLNIYFPFDVDKQEIDDISHQLRNEKLSRAIFSTMCIIDYKKNSCTSEIAYNGKTVDIVHISSLGFDLKKLSNGTLMTVSFEPLLEMLDNDEAYFFIRVPHKSLDEVFRSNKQVGSLFKKFRLLITTPFVSERYGYSVRINEARLLPGEINSIGAFHRQKLKKAVVLICLRDEYEINDSGCYRTRRLEQELYENFLPEKYKSEDVITYQWQQTREENFKGQFNFYFNLSRDAISMASMALYMFAIIILNAFGGALWDVIKMFISFIKDLL